MVLVARHPTAPVPLPPGPAWQIGNGTVAVSERPAPAAVVEVETGDGRVQQVSPATLPGVLRTALDAGLDIRRVQPVAAAGAAVPPAARAGAGPALARAGGGRRLLYGAAHRARLLAWSQLSGQSGHAHSAGWLTQVAALQLAAVVFGIGIGALLVPPLVQTTGWRVALGVALYLALVLIPASPMRPLLRVSAGSVSGGGAALAAAGLVAGVGAALIAVTAFLAARLP